MAQARNSTPEFHQGAAGYGRDYWHTYADYVDENLWVEFLLPTAFHQDSRYYTLGRGGFAKRLGYSLSRAAITRKDNGHETFNASEIFGAGAAAGISSFYYPSQERTFSKTYQLWLTSIAIDAGSNLFKSFGLTSTTESSIRRNEQHLLSERPAESFACRVPSAGRGSQKS